MRLFTAILLPDAARSHLARVESELKGLWNAPRKWPAVSWTREPNLHVTLKFLGEVPDERVPGVCDALDRVSFPSSPLRLETDRLDAFPSRGSIRVLHAHVAGDEEALGMLFSSIDSACATIGFPREHRRYRAHVTLGRARAPLRGAWEELERATAEQWPGPVFEASQFALVHSRLNPTGSVYTTLATFPKIG